MGENIERAKNTVILSFLSSKTMDRCKHHTMQSGEASTILCDGRYLVYPATYFEVNIRATLGTQFGRPHIHRSTRQLDKPLLRHCLGFVDASTESL